MTPDDIKKFKTAYQGHRTELAAILSNAFCAAYRDITGREASDRLRDKLFEAVEFDH